MSFDRYYGVRDFLHAAPQLRQSIDRELEKLAACRTEHEQRVAAISDELAQATVRLAEALLPRLDLETCRRAGQWTGFADLLPPADPPRARAEERAALEARLPQLEADPRYRDRHALRDPATGKLTREVAQLEEIRAPSADVLGRAEHPRLERLLSEGYGTSSYQVGWWRLSYYGDWEAGDQIVERFPGKADFAAVRAEVLRARATVDACDARLRDLREEIAAGETVEKDHDATAARLADHDAIVLREWQASLTAHLRGGGLETLAGQPALDPAVEDYLKTVQGLQKKIGYLDELARAKIDEPMADLRAQRAKLDHDIAKYSRPKKAGTQWVAEDFQRRFRDRSGDWERRRQRYDRTYLALESFRDYGRASAVSDFLWWDLMTDGRIDGDFIPEVAQHRAEHPGYRWHSTADDTLAAAAGLQEDRDVDDRRLDAS